MTETIAQLKYQALKDALLYAKVGLRDNMNNSIELARKYSSQLGVPLAQSVEKRIHDIYSGERLKKGDFIVVFCRDLAKEAKRRGNEALLSGDLVGLNYASNEEEIFRDKGRRVAREAGIDEVVASF